MVVSSAYLIISVGDIVVGVESEEPGTEATSLWRSGAGREFGGAHSSHPYNLWSVHEEVQDPVAGGSQLSRPDGVEDRAVVEEDYPCICSTAVQVFQRVLSAFSFVY